MRRARPSATSCWSRRWTEAGQARQRRVQPRVDLVEKTHGREPCLVGADQAGPDPWS